MASKFETILLQDHLNPVNKLEPIAACSNIDQNADTGYATTAEPSKIGEIFHVARDRFKFVCVHCFAEFSLMVQFAGHVQQHLHEIYAESFATKSYIHSDTVDIKPTLEPNGSAELPDTKIQPDSGRKRPRVKRKIETKVANSSADCDSTIDGNSNHSNAADEELLKSDPIAGPSSADKPQPAKKKREINGTSDKRKPYSCLLCDRKYSTAKTLAKHIDGKHPDAKKSYECYLCSTQCNGTQKLASHFRRTHMKKLEYCDYRYKLRNCKQCGKEFNDKSLLAKHLRWHKEQLYGRPHKCSICGRGFIEGFELRRHVAHHTATRDFKCALCEKTYKTEKERNYHMHTHTGTNKLQCDKCGKVLRDPHRLNRHMVTHTGEKPHKCEYCGKCFTQPYNLSIHKRSHTGEYIHYCRPCQKGFGARRELRKHNLRVHGIGVDSTESAPK